MNGSRIVLLAALLGTAAAADIVKNPDFAAVAGWDLPAGGAWRREAKGGLKDGPCLVFDGNSTEPVTQTCDFTRPGTDHTLAAMVRTDGQLKPVIVVLDAHSRKELAVVNVPPDPQWRSVSATFKSDSADLALVIYADAAQRDRRGARGKVWLGSVRLTAAQAAGEQRLPDLGENVALRKPYTMKPAPEYALCTDPDDKIQLTDGAYTQGHFWTRKTTVGWGGSSLRYVTIDLGADVPLKGASFSTAAGVAYVAWPSYILVFVSSDNQEWHEVGELVSLSAEREPLPAYGEYHARRIWSDKLRTHGRWVTLAIEPGKDYVFCDEIELYRGDDAWLKEPYPGKAVSSVEELVSDRVTLNLIRAQYQRDLAAATDDLAALPADRAKPLQARAAELAKDIAGMSPVPMDGFRAVLPMSNLEREIFRFQAAVWRAQNQPALRVWSSPRWDPLEPSAEPEAQAAPAVEIHTMSREHRAGVFNLTNAGPGDLQVQVKVTGLPGGDDPDYVKIHQVLCVGTRRFVAVSAALPEARREGGRWLLDVPSGMTRQVWLDTYPTQVPAGTHQGAVVVSGQGVTETRVPLKLVVYPLRFPDETTLHLGGWEYSNAAKQYGITVENKTVLIAHLQDHLINTPWATSAAMPPGSYDDSGKMVKEPDTSNFDAWVNLWPKAKRYMVFNAVGQAFAGSPMGSELFNLKVGNWAKFWVKHLEDLKLDPAQLGLLLVDEPSHKEQYDVITAWAKAINAAAPALTLYEDPQPGEDKQCREMFSQVDIICPYRNNYLTRPEWFGKMMEEERQQGRELWFYSADGPARSFDPFSYYLLQAWHAFKVGATGSHFWAFADNGGVSCWNEYPARGKGPYCPSYIDDTTVTTSKYMEACRESAQDYECLVMLRDRIAELEAKGAPAASLKAAKTLLAGACDRVLVGEKGANYTWDQPKDRTVTDQVRVEILQALTELGKAG